MLLCWVVGCVLAERVHIPYIQNVTEHFNEHVSHFLCPAFFLVSYLILIVFKILIIIHMCLIIAHFLFCFGFSLFVVSRGFFSSFSFLFRFDS